MAMFVNGDSYYAIEIPQDKVKAVVVLLGCDERTATQIVASTMPGVIYNNRADIAPCGYCRKKDPVEPVVACPYCKGRGRVMGAQRFFPPILICPLCGGEQYIPISNAKRHLRGG